MAIDAEGSLAAFTILPQPFKATSVRGITPSIPRATADPGTLSPYPPASTSITTTSAITSESSISSVATWLDRGGISIYTDVRTTGTPRVAAEMGTVSNRATNVKSGLRLYLGIWLVGLVLIQSVFC